MSFKLMAIEAERKKNEKRMMMMKVVQNERR